VQVYKVSLQQASKLFQRISPLWCSHLWGWPTTAVQHHTGTPVVTVLAALTYHFILPKLLN